MKKFLMEYKDFISKGNMLDLAIGVVIGGTFGAIVNSLVKDLIMPAVGLLLGKVDFANLYIQLNRSAVPLAPRTPLAAALEQGAVVLAYGSFLNAIITFLIIALAIFTLIKAIRRPKAEAAPAEPTEKTCPFCQTAIPVKATRCPHCTSQLE